MWHVQGKKVRLGHSRSGGVRCSILLSGWHKGEGLQQVTAAAGQSSMALPAQKYGVRRKAQGMEHRAWGMGRQESYPLFVIR